MSTNNKENTENKKKNRPRLSIKIFSGNSKKKESLNKIHEDRQQKSTTKTQQQQQKKQHKDKSNADQVKTVKDDTDPTASSSDDDGGPPPAMAFRPGRRRSLSACADVLDTMIKRQATDEEDSEEEKEDEADQLSPLPHTPTKSCLRGRSSSSSCPAMVVPRVRAATFSEGENVEVRTRERSVSFSPETVDPPPRNMKYREWIESRSKPPPVNVKHEKHKQKMNQMKKVNMSDFLASKKHTGLMSTSSSAFGGGMMM